LGGTGSYVLDFIAKTPVKEIRLFDNDQFLLHNAFRSPGAPPENVLKEVRSKVDYFSDAYSKMHRGITMHNEKVSIENLEKLTGLDFVFICVDDGAIKKEIINHLTNLKISFIDVGIGIEVFDNRLLFGMLRVTTSIKGNADHIFTKGRISFGHAAEADLYSQNIQIAELNALNAAMAVIKWKKVSGFYHDVEREGHSLYSIDDNSIINEDLNT
jgi:hypothetical protein